MHLWANERSVGQQLTLDQCFLGEYEDVTPASVALCAPGEALKDADKTGSGASQIAVWRESCLQFRPLWLEGILSTSFRFAAARGAVCPFPGRTHISRRVALL